MKLFVRTMRDKYGSRNHILFTDESGLSKPIAVLDTVAMDELIEMYYNEQQAVDKMVIK
jgi:hypothetical protein